MFTKSIVKCLVAAAIGSLALAWSASQARADVVAYYNFDTPSNLGADSAGTFNLAAQPSTGVAPSSATGINGSAASFSGSELLETSSSSITPYGVFPNVSVSFDVKPTSSAANQTISRPAGSNSGGLTFTTNSSGDYQGNFNSMTNLGVGSNVAANPSAWAYIVLTFAASGPESNNAYPGTGTFYVNGTQQGQPITVTYTPGGGQFAIGGRGSAAPSTFFSGLIDDFAVYNQTLNQDQVTALAGGALPTSVAPEPSSLGVLGLMCLIGRRRRRRCN